jgi:RNA polymerase sigma factor (sigma-70 family)
MIAPRRTIDHLRKFDFLVEPLEAPLEHHSSENPETLSDNEQLQLLDQAVQDLPPHEKILVDLVFREGLPAKDVAEILRISIGAVYTQKSRILARLREILEKSGSL